MSPAKQAVRDTIEIIVARLDSSEAYAPRFTHLERLLRAKLAAGSALARLLSMYVTT